MAPQEEQNLAPDSTLLSQIFPNKMPPAVAAMQEIRRRVTCRRVDRLQKDCMYIAPEVPGTGTATLENGREVAYFVSEFALHATTLEDIVDDLSDAQISHVVSQVMGLVNDLQKLNPDAEAFRAKLADIKEAQSSKPNRLKRGGLSKGWFDTPIHFFRGMFAALDTYKRCTVTETEDGGLKVESSIEGIDPVTLSKFDMDYHWATAIICHNDLEPRNILVRERKVDGAEEIEYEVVAIIDWEMAGFYPVGFEMANKDRVLGTSNLNFRWYREFRDQVAWLPPRAASSSAFKSPIPAFDVVVRSNVADRGTIRNAGDKIAAKWIERELLVLSDDVSKGWVRRSDAGGAKRYTRKDNQELELTVLIEMKIVPS
ncbi:hypothetical protein BDW69DRAFT_201964 [Aspergillus filifer]